MNKFFIDFLFTSVAINCITYSSRETEWKNSMYFKSYVQKSKNVSRTKKLDFISLIKPKNNLLNDPIILIQEAYALYVVIGLKADYVPYQLELGRVFLLFFIKR